MKYLHNKIISYFTICQLTVESANILLLPGILKPHTAARSLEWRPNKCLQ